MQGVLVLFTKLKRKKLVKWFVIFFLKKIRLQLKLLKQMLKKINLEEVTSEIAVMDAYVHPNLTKYGNL